MSGVGARAGSDKPQKLLRFNSAQKLPFVRMRLECIQPPKPFQAEYEGSIPFTRSNDFNGLARQELFILTSRAFSF
jgi:hypothetical protein